MKGLENIKMIKSPNKSPNKRNNKSYDKFLKGSSDKTGSSGSSGSSGKAGSSGSSGKTDKKVIRVQRKRQSPKKMSKDVRDINDIERKMLKIETEKQSIKVPTQNRSNDKPIQTPIVNPNTKQSKQHVIQPKPAYNGPPMTPGPERTKDTKSRKSPKQQKPQKPQKIRISDIDVREKRSDEILSEHKPVKPSKTVKPAKTVKPVSNTRSNTRSNKRSNTRNKSRNRMIRMRNENLGEKDIKQVSNKMREIRNTNKDEIKKELEKQGVKVSGKSDRLLKDIYLYSKVCNINIQYEK
tara:strand:- start:1 stop:885 length:885 start_codon:yes stop_codon:yes gene_type:complete